MVSVAASVFWPSAARQRRSALPCRAQRAAHPRRHCVCACASESSTGEGAASGTAQGGRALDAAAATFALLRAELPYVGPAVAAKVADRVVYSYAGGLHSCRGKEAYLALHQHWRNQVPAKLGTSWKVRGSLRACDTSQRYSRALSPPRSGPPRAPFSRTPAR